MMSWPLLSPDRNDTIPRACGSIAVVQKEVREEGVWRERDGDDDHHHHHVARCSYQVKVRFRWRKNAHFSWAKPCSCTALQPLLLLMCREEDKKKGSNKRKKQIYCQGRGSVDRESCWAKNLQSLLFLQEESIWLWGAGGLTGNFQIWNMNAHAICVLDCVCIQRKEKGEKCAYDISKLPVAECKTIFTKTLRTMCCLLMHRQHNHTQCICAGRVHWAPRLIPHKTMRSHSGHAQGWCSATCLHLWAAKHSGKRALDTFQYERDESVCQSQETVEDLTVEGNWKKRNMQRGVDMRARACACMCACVH